MGVLTKSQYKLKHANALDRLAKVSSPTILYVGPYIATVFGVNYVGDSIRNKGEALVKLATNTTSKNGPSPSKAPYQYLNPRSNDITELRSPVNHIPKFTPADVKKGYFYRYFFIDNRIKSFIETNKEEFNKSSQIDTIIFPGYKFRWYFTNPGMNVNTVKYLKKLGSINISAYQYNNIT
jgi:hypothetical protein